MLDAFRRRAAACAELGSPMYAALLDHCSDDIAAGGVVAEVLVGHDDDPGPSALALRLGAAASSDAPFAHLQLEQVRRTPTSDHEFLVVRTEWPTGERRVLGTSRGHGVPTEWDEMPSTG